MFPPDNADQSKLSRALVMACALLAVVYVAMFGINSLTRVRAFSPDSMIYVDVARNIAEGHGLMQSTLGVHDNRFLAQQHWPVPYTSQPLFPLLIAGVSRLGLSLENAALLLPVLAMAGVLALAWFLLRRAWGGAAAWTGLALLALHQPLGLASRVAWSDAPGLLLVLTALMFSASRSGLGQSAMAGIASGLALTMRYALAPLGAAAGIGLLLAARGSDRRKSLVRGAIFAVCAVACAAPVLLRNMGDREHWHLPEHQPLLPLVSKVLVTVVCDNFGRFGPAAFEGCMVIVIAMLAVLVARRRNESLSRCAFPFDGLLLLVWIACYLAFVIQISVTQRIDDLGVRLLLQASVPLTIWLTGFCVSAMRLPVPAALILCCAVLGLRSVEELQLLARPPSNSSPEYLIASSPRLAWIKENVGPDDVIIGNDTMDIPFFMRGMNVVSFSPHPKTEYAKYDKLLEWMNGPAKFAKRFYLVLRRQPGGDSAYELYGDFIGDLMNGKAGSYPAVTKKADAGNSIIFEVVRP